MTNVPALNHTRVLVLMGLALLAACGASGQSVPEERLAEWEIGFNSGDAAAVAALYSEDAVLMPPNAPMVKGRAEIEKYMQSGFSQGAAKIKIVTDAISAQGDTAVRRGTYELTAPDGALIEKGKYVEVWKKNGATWEMSTDIWNADAANTPPPAPAAPEAPPAPAPST